MTAPNTPNDPGEELVDQLDALGNSVAIVKRRQIRRDRLPHRCVYVLVFNSRDELFIHQRTATKDTHPLCWDVSVGGIPAAGEPFELAAVREGREELGVDLTPIPLFPFHYADGLNTVFGFVFRADHDGPFTFQPEEVACGDFVPLDDVKELIAQRPFCPDGLAVWAEYLRRGS